MSAAVLGTTQPVVVAVNWEAFDVPRLWDVVRGEDSELARGQVQGLRNLAELLLSQHGRLTRLRDALMDSWDPDTHPTAGRLFAVLDGLLASMNEDAAAYTSSSHALGGILSALRNAKERIAVLKTQWDSVTTDMVPEWWDEAAASLARDLRHAVVAGADTSRDGQGDGLSDRDGHGTAMAGLIAGRGRTRGVAPDATVMSVRVGQHGRISTNAIGAAVQWAVNHGAKVISISLAVTHELSMRYAVMEAISRDVVVVAGAGNTSTHRKIGYPAAYPGVVAVGGIGRDGSYSEAAVTGPELTLAAPCDDISAPDIGHRWAVGTGTSNAAALTAGAAALLRSRFPEMSAREVVHRLTATAVDKGSPGRDTRYGHGVLNVVGALTADIAPLPPEPNATATTLAAAGPVPAPGAEFPVGLALGVAAGCLVVSGGLVVLFIVLLRRRTRVSDASPAPAVPHPRQ